jgi:RNA polymerase sigma-70 factor (ECF subfamily)
MLQNEWMTEAAIIHGCIEMKQTAQQHLYDKYSSKMLAVCYRYAGSRADAEDMLQEAFIRVYGQIHQYRGQGAFEGWILRIVINTCINHLKKHKKFSTHVDVFPMADYLSKDEQVTSFIESKEIVECIRSLPVGYRTILNLFAIEGYTHKEISGMLEIEESTSRSQYMRARNLLEKILIKRHLIHSTQIRQRS